MPSIAFSGVCPLEWKVRDEAVHSSFGGTGSVDIVSPIEKEQGGDDPFVAKAVLIGCLIPQPIPCVNSFGVPDEIAKATRLDKTSIRIH